MKKRKIKRDIFDYIPASALILLGGAALILTFLLALVGGLSQIAQ